MSASSARKVLRIGLVRLRLGADHESGHREIARAQAVFLRVAHLVEHRGGALGDAIRIVNHSNSLAADASFAGAATTGAVNQIMSSERTMNFM